MVATLSTAERRILEAAHEAEAADTTGRLTDAVRHALGQLPGPEFRRGVSDLAERQLLRARVTVKEGGDVGQVVIEGTTFLGRRAIGRR